MTTFSPQNGTKTIAKVYYTDKEAEVVCLDCIDDYTRPPDMDGVSTLTNDPEFGTLLPHVWCDECDTRLTGRP